MLSSFPRFLRLVLRQILWVEATFVTFLLNLRIFGIWIFFVNILWMHPLFWFYILKKSLWPIPTTFVCIQPIDSKAVAYLFDTNPKPEMFLLAEKPQARLNCIEVPRETILWAKLIRIGIFQIRGTRPTIRRKQACFLLRVPRAHPLKAAR